MSDANPVSDSSVRPQIHREETYRTCTAELPTAKCTDVQMILNRFIHNLKGFAGIYRFWIAVFVIGILCDGASTIYFMQKQNSIQEELHPGVRTMSILVGPVAGPLLSAAGKIIAGLAVAVYWRKAAGYLLGVAGAISLWAAWYNIWGYELYIPKFLYWIHF